MIAVTPPSTPDTMHHHQAVDTAYLVTEDVGANGEGGDAIHTTKWLVPMEELDERALHRNFDPDSIGASVVPSPMRGIRGFLKMGLIVGAFPADTGERYIHFIYEFCDMRTWYIILILILWLCGGGAVITYCLLSNISPTLESLLTVKTNTSAYTLSSTDQVAILSIPTVSAVFLPIMISLSWARINSLSTICENFVMNGYRVGSDPEKMTMQMFLVRLLCFLPGQALVNIHFALAYCDTSTKQILFSIFIIIWQIPLYLATIFLGFVVMQFLETLTEYFR
jgi:hypothetical protein